MTVMVIAPTAVRAQASDPVSSARLHLGPFGVTPSISVSSGVDSNVFAEDTNPKSDVTTVANPRIQMWLRKRRLTLDIRNSTDITTFMEYRAQGGFNTRNDVQLDMPINRVRLLATHSFTTTEQRASVEIDARARRREMTFSGGADVRTSSKTFLRVLASRANLTFDEDASNQGVVLAQTLNRRMDVGTVALRYQLTGATTLAVSADAAREQFEFSTQRDSTSLRVVPGVEFDSRAIISGRAYVGYRRFTITSGLAPPYTGPVALVELSSVIRAANRLSVQVSRDVAYSYDVTTPYYLLTGATASIGRRLGERWEITANGGRQVLRYEARTTAATPVSPLGDRKDYVNTYGGGVNYLLSNSVRFGFSADYAQRQSGRIQRGYEGTRLIGHVTYGS